RPSLARLRCGGPTEGPDERRCDAKPYKMNPNKMSGTQLRGFSKPNRGFSISCCPGEVTELRMIQTKIRIGIRTDRRIKVTPSAFARICSAEGPKRPVHLQLRSFPVEDLEDPFSLQRQ